MPVSLAATCPTCNANIADDDRSCGRCGAAVSAFPVVERTPLILPGNPALSADLVRAKGRPLRVIAGASFGIIALLAVLWVRSGDDEDTGDAPLARGIEQASDSIVSEAAAPQSASLASDSARAIAVVATSTPSVSLRPPIPAASPAVSPTASTTPAIAVATPAPPSTAIRAPARQSGVTLPAAVPALAGRAPMVAAGKVTPVLRMASLVSDSLRPGELLQLRWTIQDRTTGRAVSSALEFTSADASVAQVDRRTGVVTARAPGRVRIIADAGVAGTASLDLWVRAAPRVATVAAGQAESLQMRTDAARSVSTLPATPTVRAPVVSAPPAAVTREVPRGELLDADDVRGSVDRFVNQVRTGTVKNFELLNFFQDGAGHRAALVSSPATIGAGGNIVRVTFDVRLTKFDAGGRPVTRIAPVSMDIEKRSGDVSSSAIAIGALRKP